MIDEFNNQKEERITRSKTKANANDEEGENRIIKGEQGEGTENKERIDFETEGTHYSQEEKREDGKGYDNCKMCKKNVQEGVYCKKCDKWYHYTCENTNQQEIQKEYPGRKQYVCKEHKKEEHDQMKLDNDDLKKQIMEHKKEKTEMEKEIKTNKKELETLNQKIQKMEKQSNQMNETSSKQIQEIKNQLQEQKKHHEEEKEKKTTKKP